MISVLPIISNFQINCEGTYNLGFIQRNKSHYQGGFDEREVEAENGWKVLKSLSYYG